MTSRNARAASALSEPARREERREAGGMARAGASPRHAAQPQERKCPDSGPPRAQLTCRPAAPAGAEGAARRPACHRRSRSRTRIAVPANCGPMAVPWSAVERVEAHEDDGYPSPCCPLRRAWVVRAGVRHTRWASIDPSNAAGGSLTRRPKSTMARSTFDTKNSTAIA